MDVAAKSKMKISEQSILDRLYAEAVAAGDDPENPTDDRKANGNGEGKSKKKKKKKNTNGTAGEVDKTQTLYWRSDVQEWFAERNARMWKTFHFMAGNVTGPSREDPRALLSFNNMLKNLVWCEMLDPQLTIKRTAAAVSATTFDPDVAPQNHPSNDDVLLTYDEFEETIVRLAKIRMKKSVSDDEFIELAMVSTLKNDEF